MKWQLQKVIIFFQRYFLFFTDCFDIRLNKKSDKMKDMKTWQTWNQGNLVSFLFILIIPYTNFVTFYEKNIIMQLLHLCHMSIQDRGKYNRPHITIHCSCKYILTLLFMTLSNNPYIPIVCSCKKIVTRLFKIEAIMSP